MGRIMSFDQDGQIVRDFDKSEYDFLRRYGRTPDEVMAENARLRELVSFALDCIAKGGCNLCRVHNGFCMLEDSCRDLVTEV